MKHVANLQFLVALSVAVVGCDGPTALDAGRVVGDGGPDSATEEVCTRDSECADGLFCSGDARCLPGDSSADLRGCVPGTPPCAAAEECVEAEDLCRPIDCTNPDGDGDMQASIACGGLDCDDTDPSVYTGAPEICDAADVDEDCDPSTIYNDSPGLNDGDRDGDGFVDRACANGTETGENRGTDCDDSRATINPDAVESCNGFDDDCDGVIDEGVRSTFYRDFDGDGYGVESEVIEDCGRPTGFALMPGDCDDTAPSTHPGATEVCGGGDEDCDGTTDEAGATGLRTFYRDMDGDGYGRLTERMDACVQPAGWADAPGDCWDSMATGADAVHPGADFGATPYCTSGTLCSTVSGGRRSFRCSSTLTCPSSAPAANWDRDCSGGINTQPPGWCAGDATGCRGGVGPSSAQIGSQCGQDVSYITGCGGTCAPIRMTRPLQCR